jgi:hypothetical protein|tara:strand:- start:150 stop:1067 length:918 start_codon:yes stop_codon:yes gene_type:complete
MLYSILKVSDINKKIDVEQQKEARDYLASQRELQEFMAEIRKSFRGVLFTQDAGDKRRVYVHMPNDPYVMGYIGYGDFLTTAKAMQSSYVISSRHIMNYKYADYNDQHYMAMSINLSTAVRNAKKYLRPLTTKDMALDQQTESDMRRKSKDTKSAMEVKRNNALSDLLAKSNRTLNIDYNPMLEYMRTLVTVGHEFTDKELESNLLSYFALEKDVSAFSGNDIDVDYVRVYEKYGKQVFDVVPLIREDSYRSALGNLTTYDKDKVPEDVMGKVSVLSMVENGHWVDDVGYRVDATMFYVTAQSNE